MYRSYPFDTFFSSKKTLPAVAKAMADCRRVSGAGQSYIPIDVVCANFADICLSIQKTKGPSSAHPDVCPSATLQNKSQEKYADICLSIQKTKDPTSAHPECCVALAAQCIERVRAVKGLANTDRNKNKDMSYE